MSALIDNLKLHIIKLEDTLQKTQDMLSKSESKTREYRKYMEDLALGFYQISNENMDKVKVGKLAGHELASFIKSTVIENDRKLMDSMQDMSVVMARQKQLIDSLSFQLGRRNNTGDIPLPSIPEFPAGELSNEPFEPQDEDPISPMEPSQEILPQVQTPETTFRLESMSDLLDTVGKVHDFSWNILEAVGLQGYSESNDIRDYIQLVYANEKNVSTRSIPDALKALESLDILSKEKIITGRRWFYVYELTPKGIEVFQAKYNQKPVMNEKQRLIADHDNPLHGYSIKDAKTLLEQAGWTNVEMDRKKNTLKIPREVLGLVKGLTIEGMDLTDDSIAVYIPDLMGTKPNGERGIAEVEIGKHKQGFFNLKCDKMRTQASELLFIVNNKEASNKIAQQFGDWILSKGGPHALAEKFTCQIVTMEQLKNGESGSLYSFGK